MERYEIKARLGEGGVGTVYRAWDSVAKRTVAIKRVTAGQEGEAQAQADLIREASLASSLDHPNICRILDFGTDDEGGFAAMEFVNGETLDLTAGRYVSLPEFAAIAEQLLDAVAYAHDRGIIHGDLKPSNVIIDWLPGARFRVKLLDFGLSRFHSPGSRQFFNELTQTTRGSIYFMAPEQFEDQPIDARTDIYALGCLFYFVLTQKHPFEGATNREVVENHLLHKLAHSLAELRPDVPAPVVQWIGWMMNRDPQYRPTSVTQALETFRLLDLPRGAITPVTTGEVPTIAAPPPPQPTPVRPVTGKRGSPRRYELAARCTSGSCLMGDRLVIVHRGNDSSHRASAVAVDRSRRSRTRQQRVIHSGSPYHESTAGWPVKLGPAVSSAPRYRHGISSRRGPRQTIRRNRA